MYSDPDAALGQAHAEIGALAQENADLRARLAAVEALHVTIRRPASYTKVVGDFCAECGEPAPCPTRAAARGEGDRPVEDCDGCRRATRGGYGSPVLGMCKAHGKAFLGEGDRPLDIEKERF